MIGLAYKNMNEIETAKRYFEKILVIKPHQVDTMVELGLCEASTFNTVSYTHLQRLQKLTLNLKKDN